MSLINSPIKGVEIEELGVDADIPDNVGISVPARANASIYFSCLTCLMYGRRNLLPVTWAWAAATAEATYSEPRPSSIDGVVDFARSVIENMDAYGIGSPTDAGEVVALRDTLLLVATEGHVAGLEFSSGDPLAFILGAQEAKKENRLALRQISTHCALGSIITETAWEAFKAGWIEDEERSAQIMQMGKTGVESLGGVEFSHLPALALSGFASLMLREVWRMENVWATMSNEVMCGGRVIELDDPIPDEPPRTTRNRRWYSGNVPEGIARDRDTSAEMTTVEVLAKVGSTLQQSSAPGLSNETFIGAYEYCRKWITTELEKFVPMTFMSPVAYERFLVDGRTKDLWELAEEGNLDQAWHYQFSDDPIRGREVTDNRLWGEKGKGIVFGVLLHPGMEDVVKALTNMYGCRIVKWRRDVLDVTTITLNDSTAAPFAIPATRENCLKYLIPFMMGRLGGLGRDNPGPVPYVTNALRVPVPWVNFIEIQVHRPLTSADIKEVTV